jgi:hypothetical protein
VVAGDECVAVVVAMCSGGPDRRAACWHPPPSCVADGEICASRNFRKSCILMDVSPQRHQYLPTRLFKADTRDINRSIQQRDKLHTNGAAPGCCGSAVVERTKRHRWVRQIAKNVFAPRVVLRSSAGSFLRAEASSAAGRFDDRRTRHSPPSRV